MVIKIVNTMLKKKYWMQGFRNPSTQCKLHAAEDEQETV